eukprot:SAG25_NODE_1681_length_2561_cov_3.272543_4_plen_222_part_00
MFIPTAAATLPPAATTRRCLPPTTAATTCCPPPLPPPANYGGKRPREGPTGSGGAGADVGGGAGADVGGGAGADAGGGVDADAGGGVGADAGGGAGMTRAQWERLLRHKQPKRARVDERDDTQTMTGRESLGPSTRRQFSFDPEPRKQADKISNAMFTDSSDSDLSDSDPIDSGDGQERFQQLYHAGGGVLLMVKMASLGRARGWWPPDSYIGSIVNKLFK